MEIISIEQFQECSWWYSDGTQPVWNGQKGLVVNEKGDAILLISSCSNCGDYNIIPIDNLNMVIKKYKKHRKKNK